MANHNIIKFYDGHNLVKGIIVEVSDKKAIVSIDRMGKKLYVGIRRRSNNRLPSYGNWVKATGYGEKPNWLWFRSQKYCQRR